MGGGPRSTFGVMGYSDSSVDTEKGVSSSGPFTSSESWMDAVVVTEAIVSSEVLLRKRG